MKQVFTVMTAAAVAFVLIEGHDFNADAQERTAPRLAAVTQDADKEWTVMTLELDPGAVYKRPLDASEQVIYVLAGVGTLKAKGQAAMSLQVRTATALHRKHVEVITNTSQTQKLKLLLVQRVETGPSSDRSVNHAQPEPTGPQAAKSPQLIF
ncbi:MAG TPA: hypothetical protein VFS39_15945 [Nitrospira sp.]|nr:hypothetical protein [Nitrospira sp.]